MAGRSFKPMPDLYPVAEGIIPIDRVTALFVPGNFRGIRPPVVFFSVEPFKDRRVQLRCDAKIDVWSLDRARASFGDLIHRARITSCPVFGTVSVTCASPGTCPPSVRPNVSRYQVFPCSRSVTSTRTWLMRRNGTIFP